MRPWRSGVPGILLPAAATLLGACRATIVEPVAAPRTISSDPEEPHSSTSGFDLGVTFDPARGPQGEDGAAELGGVGASQTGGSVSSGVGAESATPSAYPINGFFSAGLRSRWSSGGSDSDLFTFLSMDGGDSLRDDVTFHVAARASQDLSGGKSPDDQFFEISDTYSGGLNARLYSAYVDVHSVDQLDVLRLGRQQDIETPVPAYYDGVHVRSGELEDSTIHAGAYGGLATRLFESTGGDDRVFGAYLGSQPWDGGRVRLDWMRSRDHIRSSGDAEDIYSVSVWQTLLSTLDIEGFYSRFRDENRDVRLAGTWFEPEQDIQLRASYYQLVTRQTTSALEFDPFTSSLLDFEPYHLVSLSGSKGIGSSYRIAGGADLRRLKHEADAGQFNRDFDRFFLTFSLLELLQQRGSLNLTTDYWDGSDKEYSTFGIDFAGAINPSLRGSVGTFFSLYKINSLTFEEREDVRTYFVRLDHDLTDALRLNLDYQFEDADIADFHVLRMSVKWSF